jgi:hypothetical protein
VNTISIAPKHCVASEEESGSGIIWRKSCCFKLLAIHHEVFSLVLKGLIYARRYIATDPLPEHGDLKAYWRLALKVLLYTPTFRVCHYRLKMPSRASRVTLRRVNACGVLIRESASREVYLETWPIILSRWQVTISSSRTVDVTELCWYKAALFSHRNWVRY